MYKTFFLLIFFINFLSHIWKYVKIHQPNIIKISRKDYFFRVFFLFFGFGAEKCTKPPIYILLAKLKFDLSENKYIVLLHFWSHKLTVLEKVFLIHPILPPYWNQSVGFYLKSLDWQINNCIDWFLYNKNIRFKQS